MLMYNRQHRINQLETKMHELQDELNRLEQELYHEKNMVQDYVNALKKYPTIPKIFAAFVNTFENYEELSFRLSKGCGNRYACELNGIEPFRIIEIEYGLNECSFHVLVLESNSYFGHFLEMIFRFEEGRKIEFTEQTIDSFRKRQASVKIAE